jgi:hypothetical protein
VVGAFKELPSVIHVNPNAQPREASLWSALRAGVLRRAKCLLGSPQASSTASGRSAAKCAIEHGLFRVASGQSRTKGKAVAKLAISTVAITAFARAGWLRPNPSFNRRANGTPPGPGRWYSVHFHRPGPGGAPLPPGYLKR